MLLDFITTNVDMPQYKGKQTDAEGYGPQSFSLSSAGTSLLWLHDYFEVTRSGIRSEKNLFWERTLLLLSALHMQIATNEVRIENSLDITKSNARESTILQLHIDRP